MADDEDIRDAEISAVAKNFILEDLLENSPEYLSVAEYLDDNWIDDEELGPIDDDLIAEVYQEVARQLSIVSTLYDRFEE